MYDTTLRDGAQQEGLSLTVADKLAIARHLDDLGVGFIEGGWPGAIPKDTEFFRRAASELDLKHAPLAAFGSTRKAGAAAADDPQVAALRDSGAPVVTLVAKSHDRHVELALRTTLDENLAMIRDTVAHLRAEGQRVFLDAEHFFDGYRANPAYALEVRAGRGRGRRRRRRAVRHQRRHAADRASATWSREVIAATGARLGIHCHDDTACAVANTLAAVDAGATHVQGTANGYGERSGNANLFSVVAGLQLKKGRRSCRTARLREMTRIAHAITEVTNITPDTHQPYVGLCAFAHKAGLHASAVKVDPMLYQHIDPAEVGNDMRMLVSDMAGRASIELKGRELGYDLSGDRRQASSAGSSSGSRSWRRGATPSRPPTHRSSCCCATRSAASARGTSPSSPGGSSSSSTPRARCTSEATVQAARQGRADRRRRRGQRSGQRAGQGAADGAGADLPGAGHAVAGRLQGPHPRGSARHRRDHPGADRDLRRHRGAWATVGVGENVIAASWDALSEAVTYGLLRSGREPEA